jgi:hypothetical protein
MRGKSVRSEKFRSATRISQDVRRSARLAAHSVRGAISGALKNKRGLTIQSEMHDGRGRIYRIV